MRYTATEPKKTLLDIMIKPKNFTKENMTAVASRIKNKYCNDQYISVAIFDSKKAQVGWHYLYVISGGKNDKRRGVYSLDRNTDKEAIGFSTKPGNPIDEMEIVFTKPDETKQ